MLSLTKRKDAKKKGIWQIVGTVGGVPYRKSTGTSSKPHAEAILANLQAQAIERQVWGEKRTCLFAEAATYYMQQGGEARFLTKLIERFGSMRVNDITSRMVADAADEIYPGTSVAYRVRVVYTPMNAIIRKAFKGGLCDMVAIEKPRIKDKPVEYAGDEWFKRVLRHCNVRLMAIILFMTLTGARVQEACNLTWRHVRLERAEAELRKTKAGNARIVKLPPVLIHALRLVADALLTKLPAGEGLEDHLDRRVFGYSQRFSVNQAIERACARAKAPYMSSHKIGRHAFAARLLREGHSLKLVQEAGGWAVARMVTEHYGHMEQKMIDRAVTSVDTVWAQTDKTDKLIEDKREKDDAKSVA